jgi:hypothetical protein
MIGFLAFALLAGCSTPQRRACQQAAVFRKLSPADQQLVLHGRIRQGLSQPAVYIAWGEPNRKIQGAKGQESNERWVYALQLTQYVPIGSYDQTLPEPAMSYGGAPAPWMHPGFGYGGVGNEGLLHSSRVIAFFTRHKRVDFQNGRVSDFAVRRGGR